MILDFTIKLGDHNIAINVSQLESGKFKATLRELDSSSKVVVDMDCTFISKYSAMDFVKRYIREYTEVL